MNSAARMAVPGVVEQGSLRAAVLAGGGTVPLLAQGCAERGTGAQS